MKTATRRKPEQFLNLKRGAELLGVSYDRLRRAVTAGELEAIEVEGGGGNQSIVVTVKSLRAYRDAEAARLEESSSAMVRSQADALRSREV